MEFSDKVRYPLREGYNININEGKALVFYLRDGSKLHFCYCYGRKVFYDVFADGPRDLCRIYKMGNKWVVYDNEDNMVSEFKTADAAIKFVRAYVKF